MDIIMAMKRENVQYFPVNRSRLRRLISAAFMGGVALCTVFCRNSRVLAAEIGYREFLNDRNRPAADYSQDDREIFRIIEVIPHDACSIFPYMIDWKTEEEYNRNVPIGYEGLVYGSSHPGEIQIFESEESKPTKAYAMIEDGLKRDFLGDYSVEFATKYTKNTGLWWREEDLKKQKTEDGYFEYVGNKKGLYYINTEMIEGENGAKNGIRHEMQALPRNGIEAGKGEYEVKEPQYYWAKDYSGTMAYPTDNILSRTDFHYDLNFTYEEKLGNYRVYAAEAKKEETGIENNMPAAEEKHFDYFAKVEEGTEGDYAFESYKNGNYILKNGSYVYVGSGKGSYILKRDALTRKREWNIQNEVVFEYAGAGKGVYDVTFLFVGRESATEKLYQPSLKKVSHLKGRYALTSAAGETDSMGNMKPVYVEKKGGDYSSIITSIDFAGIDYMDKVNGYHATTVPFGAGVRIGKAQFDYNAESGDWVFHEMSDLTESDYTKVNEIKGKNAFKPGDRIYVSGQNRMYRYYCRNSFRNNEWFKLMCYMDNPGDLSRPYSDNENGQGYDLNMNSSENLVKAQKLLNSFDNTFRIDVRQRTPGELTKEEVETADLIYISDAAGIESVVQNWNNINDYLVRSGQSGLKPLPQEVTNSKEFRFTEDLSNDALLAIYDRCIYKNEGALMLTVSLRENYMVDDSYQASVKNLGKLSMFADLMENAKDFAFFIDGYPESAVGTDVGESAFNLIPRYSESEVLPIQVWPKQMGHDKYGGYKEMYNVAREGASGMDGCFNIYQFEVPQESSYFHAITWKGSEYTGHSSVGTVLPDETKYYAHWYSVSSFDAEELHKIWQILHNRKNKGRIIVQITNADLTFGENADRVIYGDEFDKNTFDVEYRILLRGIMPEMALESFRNVKTMIFFDDNYNGVLDVGETSYPVRDEVCNSAEIYIQNVRDGFLLSGTEFLNPDIHRRNIVIRAENGSGKSGQTDVWVVVQEAFDLN